MASQIITTAVTTPVTVDGDAIIVGETGSISSNQLGTALTLTGQYTAVINGDIYAINDTAVSGNSQYNFPVNIQIGPTAQIVSIPNDYSDSGVGVSMIGYGIKLVNAGTIEASGKGIWFPADESTYNDVIINSGRIYADTGSTQTHGTEAGIEYNVGYSLNITNKAGGYIGGYVWGIHITVANNYLTLINDGEIVGNFNNYGAAIDTVGYLDLTNNGTITGGIIGKSTNIAKTLVAVGSKIVNKGEIDAGHDGVAIALGGTSDIVKNKGHIDGEVHLGAGKDLFTSGSGSDLVFAGAGGDVIRTGRGADLIDGGRGSDEIHPGKGHDLMIFAPGDGKDTIFGFDARKDTIDLQDYHLSADALKSAISEVGDKVIVDLPGSDKLVFVHMHAAGDFSVHDFIL